MSWTALGRTVVDALKDTAFGSLSPMVRGTVLQILRHHGPALKAAANGPAPERAKVEQGIADILRRADFPALELKPAEALEAVGRLLQRAQTPASPPLSMRSPSAAIAISAPAPRPAPRVPPIPSAAPEGPDLSPAPPRTGSRYEPLPPPRTTPLQPFGRENAQATLQSQERQRLAAERQAQRTQQDAAAARTTTTFGAQAQALGDLGARLDKLGADASALTSPAFQEAGNTLANLRQRLARMDSLDKALRMAAIDGGQVTVGSEILQPAAAHQELASLRKSFAADLKTLRGQVATLEQAGARDVLTTGPALRPLETVTGARPGSAGENLTIPSGVREKIGAPAKNPLPEAVKFTADVQELAEQNGLSADDIAALVAQGMSPEQAAAILNGRKMRARGAAASSPAGSGRQVDGPRALAEVTAENVDTVSTQRLGILLDRARPDEMLAFQAENTDLFERILTRLYSAFDDTMRPRPGVSPLEAADTLAGLVSVDNVFRHNPGGLTATPPSPLANLTRETLTALQVTDLAARVHASTPEEIRAVPADVMSALRSLLDAAVRRFMTAPQPAPADLARDASRATSALQRIEEALGRGGALAPIPGLTGRSPMLIEGVGRVDLPVPGAAGHPPPEQVVGDLRRIAWRLGEQTDLSPDVATNNLFQQLIGIALSEHPQSDTILRELGRTRQELLAIASRGEAAMETFFANRIISDPHPEDALRRFIYYGNYRDLSRQEIDLVREATGRTPENMLFLGSGPLPLSSVMYSRQNGVRTHNVDIDAENLRTGERMTRALGIGEDQMTFEATDARSIRDVGRFDTIFLAALVGSDEPTKREILRGLYERAAPGTILVLRSADRMRRTVYPEIDPSNLGGFVPLRVWHPPEGDSIVNSVIIAIRPAGPIDGLLRRFEFHNRERERDIPAPKPLSPQSRIENRLNADTAARQAARGMNEETRRAAPSRIAQDAAARGVELPALEAFHPPSGEPGAEAPRRSRDGPLQRLADLNSEAVRAVGLELLASPLGGAIRAGQETAAAVGALHNNVQSRIEPVTTPLRQGLQRGGAAVAGSAIVGLAAGGATGNLRMGSFLAGQPGDPVEAQIARFTNMPDDMRLTYVYAGDPQATGPSAYVLLGDLGRFSFYPGTLIPGTRGAAPMINGGPAGVSINARNYLFGPSVMASAQVAAGPNARLNTSLTVSALDSAVPSTVVTTKREGADIAWVLQSGPLSFTQATYLTTGPVRLTAGQFVTVGSLKAGLGTRGLAFTRSPADVLPYFSITTNSSYDPAWPELNVLRGDRAPGP